MVAFETAEESERHAITTHCMLTLLRVVSVLDLFVEAGAARKLCFVHERTVGPVTVSRHLKKHTMLGINQQTKT